MNGSANTMVEPPVVGIVGSIVPAEIVVAAGARPLYLAADPADFGRSAAPMEDGMEAEARSLFRQALAGEFANCDLLVIASSSDAYRYLYQYLKEMVRTGQGDAVPPLLLYDLLFGNAEPVRRYSRTIIDDFARRVAMLTGSEMDAAGLAEAVAGADAVRERLALLSAQRRAGRVGGTEAMAAIAAGRTLGFADHAALLDRVGEEAGARTPHIGPRLLVASAVPLYHDRLHAVLEAAGAIVVGEDVEWGSRHGGPPIGTATMDAVADHYRLWTASARQPTGRREAWLLDQFGDGIDGIVFYVPPEDQYFGWRYPALAAAADQAGIPTLLLRDEVLASGGRAAIEGATAAFVADLAGAAA